MELEIVPTSLEGDSFGGIVIGYTLKKVAIMITVFPLLLAGLAYLQYQGIASLNSYKLQNLTQGVAYAVANASSVKEVDIQS